MKDHIVVAKHKETKKHHGLLYVNRPTPSGCDRPVLQYSTKCGFDTEQEAIDSIVSSLKPEYVKTLDIPVL